MPNCPGPFRCRDNWALYQLGIFIWALSLRHLKGHFYLGHFHLGTILDGPVQLQWYSGAFPFGTKHFAALVRSGSFLFLTRDCWPFAWPESVSKDALARQVRTDGNYSTCDQRSPRTHLIDIDPSRNDLAYFAEHAAVGETVVFRQK